MRIISVNTNGTYFDVNKADVVCVQEAKKFDYAKECRGYSYVNAGKAYHGVAIFSKIKPVSWEQDFIKTLLPEKRSVRIDLPDGTVIINVYVPSTSGKRSVNGIPIMNYKVQFLEELKQYISGIPRVVLCGDFNTCLYNTDNWYWKRCVVPIKRSATVGNHLDKMAACHPDERKALCDLAEDLNDTFEQIHTMTQYTWWNARYGLKNYEKNNGLRIDYIFTNFTVDDAGMLPKELSDHCPIYIDI